MAGATARAEDRDAAKNDAGDGESSDDDRDEPVGEAETVDVTDPLADDVPDGD